MGSLGIILSILVIQSFSNENNQILIEIKKNLAKLLHENLSKTLTGPKKSPNLKKCLSNF